MKPTLAHRLAIFILWPLAIAVATLGAIFVWPMVLFADFDISRQDQDDDDLVAELKNRTDQRDMLAAQLQDLCAAVEDAIPHPYSGSKARYILEKLQECRESVRVLAPEVWGP